MENNNHVPRWAVHRHLYDWMLHWAHTPYGVPALVMLAFAESSFFPIPPDVLLIALVLGTPQRWRYLALICTVGSVVGGLAGYGIGMFAWETVGRWIVENIAHMQLVPVEGRLDMALPAYLADNLSEALGGSYLFQVYDRWNAWIVFVFGLTPLPYKLTTITAGVARVNIPIFMAASLAARAGRFFVVAWIIQRWGAPAKRFIDRYFNLLCIAFTILLIGGFALLSVLTGK